MAALSPRQARRERKRQNRQAKRAREAAQRPTPLYTRMQRLVTWLLCVPLLILLLAAAGPGAAQQAQTVVTNLFDSYHPHPKQIEFHRSEARFKVLLAGRRSGKTYAAAREFIRRIYRDYNAAVAAGRRWDPQDRDEETGEVKPFLHYWAVAPSHEIGKIQRRETFDVIKGKKLIHHYHISKRELWLHGGILIEFKSADKPNSLVGAGLNGLWCDEAARLKPETWTGNLRPTLTDKRGWGLFSTTPLGRNWFDNEIVRRADPADEIHDRSYALFQFTSLDNPHLDPQELEDAKNQLPPRYFAREYLASRDSFQGQIYDEFSRQTHVVPLKAAPFYDPSPEQMAAKAKKFFDRGFVAGKDWGFSDGHAGVTLIFGVRRAPGVKPPQPGQPEQLEFWALAEIYESAWLDDEWLAADTALWTLWKPRAWYADPSRADLVKKWRKAGFNMASTRNDVLPGIAAVARQMHHERDAKTGAVIRAPRFYVLDRAPNQTRTDYRGCPHLIRELLGYVWATKVDGSALAEEAPVKKDDHAPDACRYAIFNETRTQGVTPAPKHPAW
jgi:hypothetical protein